MSKIKTSMIIIASTIIVLVTIVATYLSLVATGEIAQDRPTVEVTINDASKEYDGEPIEGKYFITGGQLLEGDSLRVEFDEKLINAGSYKLEPEVLIIGSDGMDKTGGYKLSVKSGKGTIIPREIDIEISEESFMYGGKLTDESYIIKKGSLVMGDRIVPSFKVIKTPIVDGKPVADTENVIKLSCDIVNSYGASVAANYTLASSKYLPIDKKPVSITTQSAEKTFDGKPLIEDSLIVKGLLPGDELEFDRSQAFSIINAGSAINDYNNVSFTVFDKDGNDVTYKYLFSIENKGTLTINKKTIEAVTPNLEFDYTGAVIKPSLEAIDLISKEDLGFLNSIGYSLDISSAKGYTDAGEYDNEIEAVILDSNSLAQGNVNISLSFGKVKINSRAIEVTAESISTIYDGLLHKSKDAYTITAGELALNQTLSIVYSDKSQLINAGKVENVIAEAKVLAGESDVSRNYTIKLVAGEIEVKPLKISIKGKSIKKVYDGHSVSIEDKQNNFDTKDKLLDGHIMTAKYSLEDSIINVGKYDTIISSVSIVDAEGSDVTNNYEVELLSGLIEIKAKDVTITAKKIDVDYDGEKHYTAFEKNNADYNEKGLADGDVVKASYSAASIRENAGKFMNTIDSVQILNRANEDVTKNYNITLVSTESVIKPQEISITLPSLEDEYDGTNKRIVKSSSINAGLTIVGHRLVLDNEEITLENKIGENTYNIDLDNISIINKYDNNRNVTANYKITVVAGTYTIQKRNILAKYPNFGSTSFSDNTIEYNNYLKTFNDIVDNTPNLVKGDMLKISYSYVKENNPNIVGSVKVYSVSEVYNSVNESVTQYYNVINMPRNLDILPKVIKVKTPDEEYDYNQNGFTTNYTAQDLLSEVDRKYFTAYGYSLRINNKNYHNVGIVDNKLTIAILKGGAPQENLVLDISYGKVTINPKKIEVVGIVREAEYTGEVIKPTDLGLTENRTSTNEKGLIAGHKMTIKYTPGSCGKNVGFYDLVIQSVTILDESDTDVTDNYDIKLFNGLLTINEKKIDKVELNDLEIPYTGKKEHQLEDDIIKNPTLVKGHRMTFANNKITLPSGVTKKPQEITVKKNSFRVVNADGTDVTENYRINNDSKLKLSITPREVSIKTMSFDAQEFNTIDKYNEYLRKFNGYDGKQNFIGDEQIVMSYVVDSAALNNVGDLKLNATAKIYDKTGMDISSNYSVVFNPKSDNDKLGQAATLAITPKTINVNVDKYVGVYSGEEQSIQPSSWDVLLDEASKKFLASVGYKLTGEAYKVTNAGSYVDFTYKLAATADATAGRAGTNNIIINATYNGLEIKPKKIIITGNSLEATYTGSAIKPNEIVEGSSNATCDELIAGHIIKASYQTNNYIDAGNFSNEIIDVDILSGTDSVKENYEYVLVPGKVNIKPKTLTAEGANSKIDFKGRNIDLGQDWYTVPELPTGYKTILTPKQKPTLDDVINGVSLTMDSFTVFDAKGLPTKNYSIVFTDQGTVSFKKIPVKLIPEVFRTTYNGKEVKFGAGANTFSFKISGCEYLTADNFSIQYKTKPIIDADVYEVVLETKDIIYDGVNILNSIILCDLVKGKCIVEKATLSVSTPSISWEYGTAIPSGEIEKYIFSDPDLTKESFENIAKPGVGSIMTANGAAGSYSNSIQIDSSNYTIIYNFGTLTITPKEVVVVAPNYSTEYGTGIDITDKTWLNKGIKDEAVGTVTFKSALDISKLDKGTYSYIDGITVNPNYKVTILGGNITVNPKEVVVVAPNYSTTQGVGINITDKAWLNKGIGGEAVGTVVFLSNAEIASLPEGRHSYIKSMTIDPNYSVTILGGEIEVKPSI